MSKKICFITTISGTLSSFVIPTAIMLHNELDVDVTFICDEDIKFAETLPSYIHYIPVAMKRGIDVGGLKSLIRLIQIFKREKFDIIQYSTPNAAMYASLAARLSGAKVRLYGQWGIRYVGFHGVKRAIFRAIERFTCINSTHVRSVSSLNREFGISEKLYPATKVKVNGNGGTIGVDLTDFDIKQKSIWRNEIHTKYGIHENKFVFGFCGRLSADKGGEELLRAFRNISQNTSNVVLLIIGAIEKKHNISPDLFEWASNSENVNFCGIVAPEEIKKYYAAMDALVHPTYREGFGMVIQEAGAMGVPVITTRIPGAGEVMVDKESCLLVKPKNVNQLEAAMNAICNDKELVCVLGANAYKRTVSLFARDIMLSHQRHDYNTLLLQEAEAEHIILTEKPLVNVILPPKTKICHINYDSVRRYNNNDRVVAIVGSRALAKKTIEFNLPSLKLIQLTSAGFDNVPCDCYAAKGIMVANAGRTYSTPIAETVVFGILQFAKRLRRNPNRRSFKLLRRYNMITELEGKYGLLLGAGNIGTSIAERLTAFKMTVDGYDPYCKEKAPYRKIIRTRTELLSSIHSYDYVICTLPDTESTREFIDSELLEEFGASAVFVNVGRKTTYNDDALYAALKAHKIKGAVLDIFQKIPNPFTNKFRRLDNVIVWPGLSAISQEVNTRLEKHIEMNLCNLLTGQPVESVINHVENVV